MENKHSVAYLRKRKMMLIMPVLIFPFVTMAFWALGGGGGNNNNTTENTGLNLQLPDAVLPKEDNADKLSFYEEADFDSLKRAETLRNDPFYRDSANILETVLTPVTENIFAPSSPYSNNNYSTYSGNVSENEKRVNQKIDELNKQINRPDNSRLYSPGTSFAPQPEPYTKQFSTDVDRLQDMMQTMSNNEDGDPEMEQLNGTLEKILDIQHPERVAKKLRERSLKDKDQVFIVSKTKEKNNVGILNAGKITQPSKNKFFSLEDDTTSFDQNAVEAVIHQTQVLVAGTVVKMRLVNDIYINGSLITKGSFVYGTAQLDDERLSINVNSIRNNNSLFPVKLEVYDLDGMAGIHIPGAISRDVAKQSADNGLQLMELSAMDPSLKAQATATGINAAKSLFSKKVKQVKVTVKAGYKILLRDKNNQE